MNKCKNCGTEFEGKFCPECGTAANAKPVCPNCGGELGENVKFCPNCGCNLASPQAAQPQAVAQPQVVSNFDWRKIIKYLPIVFFSLWAALLWAFYSAPVTLGDGFLTETVNLYGVLKDEMMSDLYSATNALIAFAVIADVYAVVFSVVYIKGSKRLRNIFTYASFALHIAIVICAAVFGSALNTYLEGFEENSGNLVAVVIALTVVFAVLQIVSVVLAYKFPSAEQEPKQRQARAKSRTPSKAKQWLSAHRTLVVVLLVVLVLGATLGTVLPITLGNIFRSGKVDKIQLGDSYAQVEKILGEPNSSTEYQYLYYSKNVADKLKEMEQIQKQAETATNFSQLSKLQSQMEKLEEELKTLEYKYIQVTFADGKVTSVMLDTKANSNSQDATKETKSISLSEIPLNAKLEYANIYVSIYYKDGSYQRYKLTNITRTTDRQVSWRDDFGTYTAEIKYGNEIGVGSVLNVTLDPNGGTLADGETKKQEVIFGYEFSLPVPAKENYVFAGWYGNRQMTDSNGQSTEKWNINKMDTALEARYTAADYEITYHNAEDAVNLNPTSYTVEDDSINLKPATKRGYTFVGWYNDSSLQNKVDNIYTSQAEDIELWAKFITTPVTTAVNNSAAGSVTPLDGAYALGQEVVVTATTNSGYTFVGWYKEDQQISTDLQCTITMTDSDITYTAKWSKVTLTVNDSSAGSVQQLTEKYKVGDEVQITATTNLGYTFVGWYKEDQQISTDLQCTITMTDSDVTYTAKWELTLYDLTFNYDSNIGDFDGDKPTKYTIEGLTLPQLVGKNGNGHFGVKWRDETGKIYTNEIPQGTTGDLTLTLTKWVGIHTWGSDGKCIYCKLLKEPYSEVDGEVKPYTMSDGKIVFGTYPQSKVEDTALQSMLNAEIQNKLPSSNNANGWTDYGYYIGGKVQSYMWYVDVNYQNEKYRGVYFTRYRPYYTGYTSSAGNTYQDDNGYNTNTVYWFKWEPITWRILSQDDSKMFIMADLIIDSQQYYHEYSGTRTIDGKTVYPNNYKESDIRKWLNDDFYNAAFDELSKDFIVQTEVDNSASTTSSSSNQYACENTLDNVFLLSYKEATNSSYGLNSSTRQLQTTDYAQCQGAYTATGSYKGCGWWWLRAPDGNYSSNAINVYRDGTVGHDDVNLAGSGVVPALNITL